MGFEIDPHGHETKYNYADIAYLINELGVKPSNIVGGYIASPVKKSKFNYLLNEIKGNIYDFTWEAEALWGGGVGGHKNESDLWASGIWNPKSAEDIMVDGGTLPNIGRYNSTWEGLDYLLTKDLDPNKIYTASVFISQGSISETDLNAFRAEIEKHKSDDRIEWVGLSEALDIWASEYNSEPNTLIYDGTETGGKDEDTSSTSSESSVASKKCGDGICQEIEEKVCPEDC